MKPIITKKISEIFFIPFFVLLAITGFSSCASSYKFTQSTVVPAAEGTVKVTRDKNKNYHLSLKIKHLAAPERLVPAKSVYVVWMETAENGVKNIGQLKTARSLLSKTLKSSLNTVASFKPTAFFITAESEGNIQYPGSIVVLRTANK